MNDRQGKTKRPAPLETWLARAANEIVVTYSLPAGGHTVPWSKQPRQRHRCGSSRCLAECLEIQHLHGFALLFEPLCQLRLGLADGRAGSDRRLLVNRLENLLLLGGKLFPELGTITVVRLSRICPVRLMWDWTS